MGKGILGGIGSFLFGDDERPTYQAPQQAVPSYQSDAQGDDTLNALYQTIIGRQLGNYNSGGTVLGEQYRQALQNQSRRQLDEEARLGGAQVAEQLNQNNLLGSSAHGIALGEIGRERVRRTADLEDQLTEKELAQLNNATSQAGQLAGAFRQRAQDKFQGASWNYGAQQQNAQNSYQSQGERYDDTAGRNGQILSALAGAYGASGGGGAASGYGRMTAPPKPKRASWGWS